MSFDASDDRDYQEEVWGRACNTQISLPKQDTDLMDALRAKHEYYKQRSDRLLQWKYCTALLDHLFERGTIRTGDVLDELQKLEGLHFDIVAFATAVDVIRDYAASGCCNGKWLPGLEHRAPRTPEKEPSLPDSPTTKDTRFRIGKLLLRWLHR